MEPSGGFAGPMSAPAGLFDAVVALSNHVFRATRAGDMGGQFSSLFRPDRLDQLRVILHDGRPVSLVGAVPGQVLLLGCWVGVACIGSVCTDERFRGQGLAGKLVDDAARYARDGGAAMLLISGSRSLYTRRGAFRAGECLNCAMPVSSLPPAWRNLAVTELTPETMRQALRFFEGEPIRWRRSLDDYARQLGSGWVLDRPGATYLVMLTQEPAAVVSVNRPQAAPGGQGGEVIGLREVAGDRAAALRAMSRLARLLRAQTVEVTAYAGDLVMRQACSATGAEPQRQAMPYTIKLLDVERLWAAFRPLLIERLDEATVDRLGVSAEADDLQAHTLIFELDGERLEVPGAEEMLKVLFGAPGADPLAAVPGEIGDILRRVLPLPLPLYGLNYV